MKCKNCKKEDKQEKQKQKVKNTNVNTIEKHIRQNQREGPISKEVKKGAIKLYKKICKKAYNQKLSKRKGVNY